MLAFLFDEPGAALVERSFGAASISTANWAEVWQRALERPPDDPGIVLGEVIEAGLVLEPVSRSDAERAAHLRARTRRLGLSLADRCCLTLAARLGQPVLTADRAWDGLDVGVEVRLVRHVQ